MKTWAVAFLLICFLPLAGCDNSQPPEEHFTLSIGDETYTPLGKTVEIRNRYAKETFAPLDIADFAWLEPFPRRPSHRITRPFKFTQAVYDHNLQLVKQVNNDEIDMHVTPGPRYDDGIYYMDMRITWGNEDQYVTKQFVYRFQHTNPK